MGSGPLCYCDSRMDGNDTPKIEMPAIVTQFSQGVNENLVSTFRSPGTFSNHKDLIYHFELQLFLGCNNQYRISTAAVL